MQFDSHILEIIRSLFKAIVKVILATLKNRPCQANQSEVGKTPKPDRNNAAQAKRGGGKSKTFFSAKPRKVESRGGRKSPRSGKSCKSRKNPTSPNASP